MPVDERQLATFADKHAWQIPFDTSPRYLVGPGDARHVTHGLAAVGWTLASDPLSAEIVLQSPDRRYSLQFDPQSATFAWWRLRSKPTDAEPDWYAEFGELVPAEILAGVTDALVRPTRTESPDPWQTLSSAGWLLDAQNSARSPDTMCQIQLRSLGERDTPSWHIQTYEHDQGRPTGPRIWHAWFDHHTPTHLVSAFITALADTAPLQRSMSDRIAHYSAVQEQSTLTPQQVADAHTSRLGALRTQARAARRRQRTVADKALAPPPTTSASPLRR
ncbi:DUF317 domain-containing protein [Streptomyces sp. NPDC001443]